MWTDFHAWSDVPPQPSCTGVLTKASRWIQLGPSLAAVFTAAGMLPVSNVARAAGIPRGGAVALHPKLRACLRPGRVLIVALQVDTQGSSPRAVDPNVQVLPSAQGRVLSYY